MVGALSCSTLFGRGGKLFCRTALFSTLHFFNSAFWAINPASIEYTGKAHVLKAIANSSHQVVASDVKAVCLATTLQYVEQKYKLSLCTRLRDLMSLECHLREGNSSKTDLSSGGSSEVNLRYQKVSVDVAQAPIITTSNHNCYIDDPAIWQLLSLAEILHDCWRVWKVTVKEAPKPHDERPSNLAFSTANSKSRAAIRRTRWTLGAHDICFTNPLYSAFFVLCKVIPVRRGQGLDQHGLRVAKELLGKDEWIHLFPEGKVNATKSLLPFRWGVGKLIADGSRQPLVLPMYIREM